MHYVIVVHGIGEQRKNETVLNVINRFAEASRGFDETKLDGILTLGKASGQTGKEKLAPDTDNTNSKNIFSPWLEFRGIPQPDIPDKQQKIINNIPFYGEEVNDEEKGQNIRFVDLCWADIMESDADDICQSVDVWAEGLMGRLKLKNQKAKLNHCEYAKVPSWIIKILSNLVDIFIILQTLMSFKIKEVEYKIFTEFLGDVQLYGEYPITRGKAIRRFHRLMARIEEGHKKELAEKGLPYSEKPTYTIIAHSLGTIMSLDSLLYAHVNPDIRTGPSHSNFSNLPFPGYLTKEDASRKGDIDFINTNWVERVKSFVTLGSPIDKYLVMWWLNYKYLLEKDIWKGPVRNPIKHFNYSDELDPVGHNLDIVEQTVGYQRIFKKEKDVVFNRYSVFGAAHNEYWKDCELFRAIYANTVARKNDNAQFQEVKRFSLLNYLKLLLSTYLVGPLLVSAIAAMSFEWAFSINHKETWFFDYHKLMFNPNHNFQTIAIAFVALFTTIKLGTRWIKISILGRQVQRMKAKKMKKEFPENLIRGFFGWSIIAVLITLPPILITYALSDMNVNVLASFGINFNSFSFKWFVAFAYIYMAIHFFIYKASLYLEKTEISNYGVFSKCPLIKN